MLMHAVMPRLLLHVVLCRTMVAYDASTSGWPWRNVNLRTSKLRTRHAHVVASHAHCCVIGIEHSLMQQNGSSMAPYSLDTSFYALVRGRIVGRVAGRAAT
jgi:hypothetical protein